MRRTNAGSFKVLFTGLLGFLLAAAATLGLFAASAPDDPPGLATRGSESPLGDAGVEVAQHGGYPELRVDGEPFFVHSAVFFYFRIPRDLWETSLERYGDLGINTIDLPIPWNWHEPREGELDFDGHTNPRRDLRGLLKLIAEKGFKLTVRPGPVIGARWRHGGYPEWLLARPEYNMDAVDRLAGEYPPLAELAARDAEAAAQGWLENATHIAAVRKWLDAVARELAPYTARRKLPVALPASRNGEKKEQEISGPLLFVQLDDSPAFDACNADPPSPGHPHVRRYLEELRGVLVAGGVDALYTVNPVGLRDSGPRWAIRALAAPGRLNDLPIGVTGQWFLNPQREASSGVQRITAQDAATLGFLVETLKTQPSFPPMFSDYQAGWHAPADDVRPPESAPANTLLSSRLLLAHGLHGLAYSPLQDTLSPAGYETSEANRYYRWDAALDLAGNKHPRAHSVARNGQLLETWSELLAASHKRADFGLVDPRGSYPAERIERADVLRISHTLMQVQRVAQLASLSEEFLDPVSQPVEQLLRHAVVLLPVFDPGEDKFRLSEKAQKTLVEYVRRGGTLICFPSLPAGRWIEQLWKPAPVSLVDADTGPGKGRAAEWTKDFHSWVALDESMKENRSRPPAAWATQALQEILMQNGVRPAVLPPAGRSVSGELVVAQLAANEGTGALGARRRACAPATLCGSGLLSVTNLSYDDPAEELLAVLSPRADARGRGDDYIPLALLVPPRESLLLPLHFSLCSEAAASEKCNDEIVGAGAELLRVERDGKTLELTFYTPARATLLLKLQEAAGKIALQEMNLQGKWSPDQHLLEVSLPRGASPDFLRVLKIHLHYTPRVPPKPDPHKRARRDLDVAVMDSVRLPLSEDISLPTFPPLILLNQEHKGELLFGAENYDAMGRSLSVGIEGAVHGSGHLMLDPKETRMVRIGLTPAKSSLAEAARAHPDGLLRGELRARSGHIDRGLPILFAVVGKGATAHYQADFDRDAATEWVLENERLRLVLSPEAGGRAIALVDKPTGMNLTTTVGALRDLFVSASIPSEGSTAQGSLAYVPGKRDATFNRAYRAEWVHEPKDAEKQAQDHAPDAPAVRLSYLLPPSEIREGHPGGARIEKTVQLAGTQSVEVDYRVTLEASSAPARQGFPPQSFVATNSVPARKNGELTTHFCWNAPSEAQSAVSPTKDSKEGPATPGHCENFAPGGGIIEVPEGVQRIEVRTPGRAGLALEWKTGRMTVEMKNFSALLRLQFPSLSATPGTGGEPGKYQVRYTVIAAE
ncbi:MAG: beta-galactosidase [Acidobacteria bacterium]|nr:beta-galactosidase [Acidobacteriota bacterium]